jgi:hypothetical protein
MKLCVLATLAACVAAAAAALTVPPWDYTVASRKEYCQAAPGNVLYPNNSRWVFSALPDSAPPANGYPVVLYFVTDHFSSEFNHTCGAPSPGPGPMPARSKPFFAFSTPEVTLASCFFPNGTFNPNFSTCGYDQMAGSLWDQRIKQYLVANGFAVIQINPIEDDSWDAYEPDWAIGVDQPFIQAVFKSMKEGVFGPLDLTEVIFRGWSGGAQMVSWMISLQAEGQLDANVHLKGGIFLSGGSQNCYFNPPLSHGVCANCNISDSCSPWHSNAGCSSNMTHTPCCSKCCPTDFTEQYYATNPSAYPSHPPCFLSQLSTQDENADLCACSNYYNTLKKHGAPGVLHLSEPEYDNCFCIGDPRDPAAQGSPYLKYCTPSWNSCRAHTLGFASMVEPFVNFCLSITSA